MNKFKFTAIVFSILISSHINTLKASTCQSIVMTNNYIKTAISCDATLGYGGGIYPGLQYDSSGQSNFIDFEDIIIPGSSHEIFSVKYDNIIKVNNNDDYDSPEMETFISGNQNLVFSTSIMNDKLKIKHIYTLLENSKLFQIKVSIENISQQTLHQVKYMRSVDPDFNDNEYDTTNTRGNSLYDVTDLVQADLPNGGTISLFTDEKDIVHNTSVSDWTEDPDEVLLGVDVGDGDYTIDIAFDLQDLEPAEKKEFEIGYLLNTTLEETNQDIEASVEIIKSSPGLNINVTDENGTDIAFDLNKLQDVNVYSLNSLPAAPIRKRLVDEGLELNISALNAFSIENTFTIAENSSRRFTGYQVYSQNNDEWYALGTKEEFPSSYGYSISADGKTMIVTLKDGERGDTDELENGVIEHIGFPELNKVELPEENQQTVVTTHQTNSESLPIPSYAKLLMSLIFVLIAFAGIKRAKEA